jgi:hypothetical protein
MSESLLHLLTLRHTPETCPAANPDMREKCGTRLQQLVSDAPSYGALVRGGWADVAGHTFVYVIEAPNAHVISDMVTGLELFHWSTAEIRPVVLMV